MIGKATRGWNVYGLIYYLMGKGSEQSPHTDQHVIASWDGCPDLHQPAQLGPDQFSIGDLVRDLRAPARLAGLPNTRPKEFPEIGRTRIPKGPVWQCSLRNHPDDPILTDEQWTEVVHDVLDRTGIAPYDDLGACRWVAIRHADDHVHIAAVLVRQDTGKVVHPHHNFDYRRVKEACTAAEQRLGLVSTGKADRTATPRPTRAETEKAVRLNTVPVRDRLRQQVQFAALAATNWDRFQAHLVGRKLEVRVHRDRDGGINGYAVTDPADPACQTAQGKAIYFSGSKLAPDLSLPHLQTRWTTGAGLNLPFSFERVMTSATDAVRQSAADPDNDFRRETAEGIAHATEGLLLAAYWMTEPASRTAAREAWQSYGRAARVPFQVMPDRWSMRARQLRGVSRQLVYAASRNTGSTTTSVVTVIALVTAVVSLLAEIAAWHETRSNPTAARHARQARTQLAVLLPQQTAPAESKRRAALSVRTAVNKVPEQQAKRRRQP